MGTKPFVIAQIGRTWDLLHFVLEGVPEERKTEPVIGGWSIKDLMGHLAVWDDQAAAEAERRSAGAEPRKIDFQAINDASTAAAANNTMAQQRTRMERAHANLLAVLDRLEEVEPAWVDIDTYLHYSEHAAEVAAWRVRKGI